MKQRKFFATTEELAAVTNSRCQLRQPLGVKNALQFIFNIKVSTILFMCNIFASLSYPCEDSFQYLSSFFLSLCDSQTSDQVFFDCASWCITKSWDNWHLLNSTVVSIALKQNRIIICLFYPTKHFIVNCF